MYDQHGSWCPSAERTPQTHGERTPQTHGQRAEGRQTDLRRMSERKLGDERPALQLVVTAPCHTRMHASACARLAGGIAGTATVAMPRGVRPRTLCKATAAATAGQASQSVRAWPAWPRA